MKKYITTAPVLAHFDYQKESYIKVDFSNYVHRGVLSQKDNAEIIHFVVFFSKKLNPAECNYEIYNKKLLAIVSAFEHWRPELEKTDLSIQIITDYKVLKYFIFTKKLIRCQAR